MKKLSLIVLMLLAGLTYGQENKDALSNTTLSESLLQKESKLSIGGYGHVDYNQTLSAEQMNNGKLDVHRLVLLFGYQFNKKTGFVTEVEFEHVQEVYIEQAYLNHKFSDQLNFRAGLLLVPMGIINEYHEPTLYNGVERPLLDNNLLPSTWREIGIGITGRFNELALKYQLYVMNGVLSYKSAGLLTASGFRSGRQKGAESVMSSPNFTGRIEHYGLSGFKFGLSGWYGPTQSALYQGIDKSDQAAITRADSSVVDMSMLGLDVQFNKKGLEGKFQYYLTYFDNTVAYNSFTGNKLASTLSGYYIELGYNVFSATSRKDRLIPFVRFSDFSTQAKVEAPFEADLTKSIIVLTSGLTYHIAEGAVLKADYQWINTDASDNSTKILNLGVGFMF
jgi:hypothetical protein